MKRILIIILLLAAVALLWQLFQLYLQNSKLENSLGIIEKKLNVMNEENGKFQADLGYFASPENLEKELRSRFNYKKIGEKMIIVIPSKNDN